MAMKKQERSKPYEAMNAQELARATRDLERERPGLPGKALTAAQRSRFRRALRGRPSVGQGVKVISLSVEKSLLSRTDAAAAQAGLKRAQFVAKALEQALGAA
jgi:hypothetical protein